MHPCCCVTLKTPPSTPIPYWFVLTFILGCGILFEPCEINSVLSTPIVAIYINVKQSFILMCHCSCTVYLED